MQLFTWALILSCALLRSRALNPRRIAQSISFNPNLPYASLTSEGLARLLIAVSHPLRRLPHQRHDVDAHGSGLAKSPLLARREAEFQILPLLPRRVGMVEMAVKKRSNRKKKMGAKPKAGFGTKNQFSPPDWNSLAWQSLQNHLDSVPVFTTVDKDEQPIRFDDEMGSVRELFFVDPVRAEEHFNNLTAQVPDKDLSMMPVGLGEAFRKHVERTGLLLPSTDSLERAGQWESGDVPLFTCFGIKSTALKDNAIGVPEGTATLPLFLDAGDASASLNQAIDRARAAGMTEEELSHLQLAQTTLTVAVEMVLSGTEEENCGARFQFVAPRSSMKFLDTIAQAEKSRLVKDLMQDQESKTDSLLFPER